MLPVLEKILKHIEEYGPYDGLMGFSMGGGMVHLLTNLMKKNNKIPIKFVVFQCSTLFMKNNEFVTDNSKTINDIPSIHFIGDNDTITFERGLLLSTLFSNAEIIFHQDGHKFPKLN